MRTISFIYFQVFERDPATNQFPIIATTASGEEYQGTVRDMKELEALKEAHPHAFLSLRGGSVFRQLREDW